MNKLTRRYQLKGNDTPSKRRAMLHTVNTYHLDTGSNLAMVRLLEHPVHRIRQLIGNHWITINCSDDIGRTASLLAAIGYEADMLSALNMLDFLSLT